MSKDMRKAWQKTLTTKAHYVQFSRDGLMTRETATMQRNANTAESTCVQLSQETKGLEVNWRRTFEDHGFELNGAR
jgi:hypothetical protein